MRYTRAAAYARANLGAIRQLLEKSGSAIERVNLEDRIEEWEGEVTAAERLAATLAEAAVLFDGTPVKASIGIDAAFGGQSVRVFQELVTTVAADLSPRGVGERGRLPADVPRLLITDVDVGSFGFQLAEVPDQEPPAGPSRLKDALDVSTRLLKAAGESDDAFAHELAERSPRVLKRLKDFLEVIDDAGATLKVETGRASLRFETAEHIRAARERASSTQVEEASEAKVGVLQGLMQERARFELRLDDGTVLAGRIDPSVDPATFAGLYNRPVRASLRKLTISRGGRPKVAWLLLDASAP
ncbi:hypothetical protein [Sorangium sp. So ce388]|uniref:hypothetical protein n=1 Tax=Sorangium sp. So ce388 TaxID=3133309 RepID=UPI003F5BE54D